jgi:hypothetical protein
MQALPAGGSTAQGLKLDLVELGYNRIEAGRCATL